MEPFAHWIALGAIGWLGVLSMAAGAWLNNPPLMASGGIGASYALIEIANRFAAAPAGRRRVRAAPAPPVAAAHRSIDPSDSGALVEQMLSQDRYALLLRPQVVETLTHDQFLRAKQALEQAMALVGEARVTLEAAGLSQGGVIHVEPFYLDRFTVTNRQFYEFVAAEAYRQPALWETSIWPAVAEMIDSTGAAGPRWWREGCFEPGQDSLPVVGICWHEAAAYARWAGKRLPSDAEWVRAAAYPDNSPGNRPRPYPWGDAMEAGRANLWGSGLGRVAAVDQFSEGATPNGICQLIGNVWQWTSGNFRGTGLEAEDDRSAPWSLPSPWKNIRGGAFDTYFDSQATCQFVSGEDPRRRRRNIGFRCAIGVCDLVPEVCT